jgi:hypothetical protein
MANIHQLSGPPFLRTLHSLAFDSGRYSGHGALPTASNNDARNQLNSCMHRALDIEEIVESIARQIDIIMDSASLVSLALTSRFLSKVALDVLWEEPPLWHLAQRMSPLLWEVVEGGQGWNDYWPTDTVHTIVRALTRISFSSLTRAWYRNFGRKLGRTGCCLDISESAFLYTRKECDPLF